MWAITSFFSMKRMHAVRRVWPACFFACAAAWLALALPCAASGQVSMPPVRWISGEPFVRIDEMAQYYGMTVRRESGDRMTLSSRWSRMTFDPTSRKCEINGITVWLHEGLRPLGNTHVMTRADAHRLVDPMLRSHIPLRGRAVRVVVLDPGHGGRDPGAISPRNVEEKNVALDVARRTQAYLQGKGFIVRMTREQDADLTLQQRVALARGWRADLFISIHMNAATAPTAEGIETYIMTSPGFPSTNTANRARIRAIAHPGNAHDEASTVAGASLHRMMLGQTRAPDRGLRLARFHVLQHAPCPAVLVECGYLTHQGEERKIMDPAYRNQIALGIARGIMDYASRVQRAQLGSP